MNGTAMWLQAAACLAAGGTLGGLYFRGLRLTIDRLPASRRPGTLLLASFVVRAAAALALFGLVAGLAQGHGLVAALLGFVAARGVMVRRARRELQLDPGARSCR